MSLVERLATELLKSIGIVWPRHGARREERREEKRREEKRVFSPKIAYTPLYTVYARVACHVAETQKRGKRAKKERRKGRMETATGQTGQLKETAVRKRDGLHGGVALSLKGNNA